MPVTSLHMLWCRFNASMFVSWTCSFPMQWCVFDPAQLIKGRMQQSSRLCVKEETMQCVQFQMSKCNDQCDAMQHHHLRSNSPLIAVAENKCHFSTSSRWHVSLVFFKISNIKYLNCWCMMFFHVPLTYMYMIEGSLEVKLPTIWRDEKQSRAEAERRGRLEEKE